MKKIALFLAIVMTAGSLAACSDDTPDTTTDGSGSESNPAQTTQGSPEQTTAHGDDITEPAESTDNIGTPSTPAAELSYPAEDVYKLPGGKVGDTDLEGYEAWGVWSSDDGKMRSEDPLSMFIVTNDRMSAGRLTATFTSSADSRFNEGGIQENDNGIIFGMEDMTEDEAYYFWEEPYYAPRYYFLFVSDNCTLYLAKVACNGQAWTELAQSQMIIGYAHGGTVTISAEFDGKGNIKCYANDELLFEYSDPDGPTGSRYGIRAEVEGVVYDSLIAEHSEE